MRLSPFQFIIGILVYAGVFGLRIFNSSSSNKNETTNLITTTNVGASEGSIAGGHGSRISVIDGGAFGVVEKAIDKTLNAIQLISNNNKALTETVINSNRNLTESFVSSNRGLTENFISNTRGFAENVLDNNERVTNTVISNNRGITETLSNNAFKTTQAATADSGDKILTAAKWGIGALVVWQGVKVFGGGK